MTNQIYLAVWSSSRVEYRETCFSSHQLIGWAFLRRFPCMWGLAGWCPRDRSSSGWCLTKRSSKGLTDRTCLLWHGIWFMALPIFPNCFSLLQIHWKISSDQASVMNLEGRNDNFEFSPQQYRQTDWSLERTHLKQILMLWSSLMYSLVSLYSRPRLSPTVVIY